MLQDALKLDWEGQPLHTACARKDRVQILPGRSSCHLTARLIFFPLTCCLEEWLQILTFIKHSTQTQKSYRITAFCYKNPTDSAKDKAWPCMSCMCWALVLHRYLKGFVHRWTRDGDKAHALRHEDVEKCGGALAVWGHPKRFPERQERSLISDCLQSNLTEHHLHDLWGPTWIPSQSP